MEDSTPSNTEQEILAEIQVYRNKQERWEESKLARMIRRGAIYFTFWSSLAWCMVLAAASFVPSILPSNHPKLSAINAGFLLAGVNLGLYDIVMLPSEKKSITQLDHYEARAVEDKKAHGLLDQLKKNQETYQRKVEEELRKSFLWLSRLLVAICSNILHANLKYNLVGESYVAGFLFCVFFFSTYAAHVYCDNMAHSVQKSEEKLLVKKETLIDFKQELLAEIEVYRNKQKQGAAGRRKITCEKCRNKINDTIWSGKKKPS